MYKHIEQPHTFEPGDHAGLVYGSPSQQWDAVVQFVKGSIQNGYSCVYVADDNTAQRVSEVLASSGLDVRQHRASGGLVFLTRWQYRPAVGIDRESMARVVEGLRAEAISAGYKGLALAVEMTWALQPEVDQERLRQWEAFLNTLLDSGPAYAL